MGTVKYKYWVIGNRRMVSKRGFDNTMHKAVLKVIIFDM